MRPPARRQRAWPRMGPAQGMAGTLSAVKEGLVCCWGIGQLVRAGRCRASCSRLRASRCAVSESGCSPSKSASADARQPWWLRLGAGKEPYSCRCVGCVTSAAISIDRGISLGKCSTPRLPACTQAHLLGPQQRQPPCA